MSSRACDRLPVVEKHILFYFSGLESASCMSVLPSDQSLLLATPSTICCRLPGTRDNIKISIRVDSLSYRIGPSTTLHHLWIRTQLKLILFSTFYGYLRHASIILLLLKLHVMFCEKSRTTSIATRYPAAREPIKSNIEP